MIARPVKGDDGVSVGGQRLQSRVEKGADLGAERIQRYHGALGAFGAQQDETVESGQISTVGVFGGGTPAHGDPTGVVFVGYCGHVARCSWGRLVGQGDTADEGGTLAQQPVGTDGLHLVEEQAAADEVAVDVGRPAGGEAGPLGTFEPDICVVGASRTVEVITSQFGVVHRLPADDDATDLVPSRQALRSGNPTGPRLARRRRSALVADLVEGDDGVNVDGQALETGVLPLSDVGADRVGGDEGPGAPLGPEQDEPGQTGQLLTIRVGGGSAPAHDDPIRDGLVGHGGHILGGVGTDAILSLRPDANGDGSTTLVAAFVEGEDRVEVGTRLLEARVFVTGLGYRGDADEGVRRLLGTEHDVSGQTRHLAPIGISLRHVPGDRDVAEVGNIGYSRKVPGGAGGHFVVLGLSADERRQLADRVVPPYGADAVEEQVTAGQIAVYVGGTPGGEGTALGALETDIPVVRARRAEEVITDEGLVLDGPPGDDDATDSVDCPDARRCRQSRRGDLHRCCRSTDVPRRVEGYHAVAVGGERPQPRILELARPGQQRVDGDDTAGAGLGAQDDVTGQTGQIATIAVVLWRRPAEHDAPEHVLVGNRGQALWRLGRDVVYESRGADEGGQFALQPGRVDGGDAVEVGAVLTADRVGEGGLARCDSRRRVAIAGNEGVGAVGPLRPE